MVKCYHAKLKLSSNSKNKNFIHHQFTMNIYIVCHNKWYNVQFNGKKCKKKTCGEISQLNFGKVPAGEISTYNGILSQIINTIKLWLLVYQSSETDTKFL